MDSQLISGIYAIQRKDSDECYIGSAVNIADRWRCHRRDLRLGNHHSLRLRRVYDKHGAGVLEFAILEPVADKARLIEREQVWLDRFKPVYNSAPVAGSTLGFKHSAETIAKWMGNTNGAANKGHKHSTETRARLAAALMGNTRNLGRTQTPEVIAAKSARMMGNKAGDETRARMSASHKGKTYSLGHKQTPQHIANSARARTGLKRGPCTPEHRAAIVAGMAAARANRIVAEALGHG